MKYIFAVFLSLFILPSCLLADACSDPVNYTIDRRCYVSDKQQSEKPFNSIVRLQNMFSYCSGVLVKNKDKIYLYTNKHCVDGWKNDFRKSITVKTAKKNFYTTIAQVKDDVDLAIYNLEAFETEPDTVSIANNSASQDIKIVGYGALKIMDDKTITRIKDDYISYLWARSSGFRGNNYADYGILSDGVVAENEHVKNYLRSLDIFEDDVLKVSVCKYLPITKELENCQGWFADSGAGIFNNNNDLVGMVVGGKPIIGGKHHAKIQDFVDLTR